MNYEKIYNQLIDRAKSRVPEGYVERHHIVPKCMGGSDEADNLVALYPEEHFVAHALLLKIHKKTKYRYALARACKMMTMRGSTHKRITRKLYGWLKKEFAAAMSNEQSGEGNSQHGTMWICSISEKKNRKVPSGSVIPDGWVLGRNKWNLIKSCKECGSEFSSEHSLYCSPTCKKAGYSRVRKENGSDAGRLYSNGYEVEVDGVRYRSISEAADANNIGHETARMRFKSPNFTSWVIIRN